MDSQSHTRKTFAQTVPSASSQSSLSSSSSSNSERSSSCSSSGNGSDNECVLDRIVNLFKGIVPDHAGGLLLKKLFKGFLKVFKDHFADLVRFADECTEKGKVTVADLQEWLTARQFTGVYLERSVRFAYIPHRPSGVQDSDEGSNRHSPTARNARGNSRKRSSQQGSRRSSFISREDFVASRASCIQRKIRRGRRGRSRQVLSGCTTMHGAVEPILSSVSLPPVPSPPAPPQRQDLADQHGLTLSPLEAVFTAKEPVPLNKQTEHKGEHLVRTQLDVHNVSRTVGTFIPHYQQRQRMSKIHVPTQMYAAVLARKQEEDDEEGEDYDDDEDDEVEIFEDDLPVLNQEALRAHQLKSANRETLKAPPTTPAKPYVVRNPCVQSSPPRNWWSDMEPTPKRVRLLTEPFVPPSKPRPSRSAKPPTSDPRAGPSKSAHARPSERRTGPSRAIRPVGWTMPTEAERKEHNKSVLKTVQKLQNQSLKSASGKKSRKMKTPGEKEKFDKIVRKFFKPNPHRPLCCPCETCPKFHKPFSEKRFLLRHFVSKHGGNDGQGEKYQCDWWLDSGLPCGKTYTRKDSHDDHVLTHNKANWLICPYCKKEYRQRQSIDSHLKRTHDSSFKTECEKHANVRIRDHIFESSSEPDDKEQADE